MPRPAAITKAVAIAIAVVSMYKTNALVPIRPSRRTSPIPHTLQMGEKSTSGTTIIFKALTNISPTT